MMTGSENKSSSSKQHPLYQYDDEGGFSSSTSSSLASSSAGSTAFHYPILGLVYLLTSPSMVCSVICAIIVGITIAITALLLLLTMTLQSQSRGIAHMFGGGVVGRDDVDDVDDESSAATTTTTWWSYVIALFAVLFETTLLTVLLLKVIHGKSQKKIFVQTMKLQQQWNQGAMVEPSGIDIINCCKLSFIISLLTFPLHIVFPLVGTVVYALLNGRLTGWEYMDMYFHAIHMNGVEQRREVLRGSSSSLSISCLNIYSNPYTQFGFICGLLESIPIFGPSIFPLSNACGAALYACELERRRRCRTFDSSVAGEEKPSSSSSTTPYQSYHNAKLTKGE